MTTYVRFFELNHSGTFGIDAAYLCTAAGGEQSNDAIAVLGNGSNHSVTVLGYVRSLADTAVVLGDSRTADHHNIVRVGATGSIEGEQNGVSFISHDSFVSNAGAIFGRVNGITFEADIGLTRVVNTGTIIGDAAGIRSTGSHTLVIANAGTIVSELRAIATFGGTTAQISNTGEIIGEIYLDSGNDVYIGTNGRLSGKISGFGGNDTVYAGIDNDIIDGMGGNDVIVGGAGNDLILGGTGNDALAGGSGNDVFRLDTAPNASTNIDRITDFSVPNDTIQLENAVFTKLGSNTGALNPGLFAANPAGVSTGQYKFIVYDTDDGSLYYDTNGNAAGGSTLIARLSGTPALTAADFVVI